MGGFGGDSSNFFGQQKMSSTQAVTVGVLDPLQQDEATPVGIWPGSCPAARRGDQARLGGADRRPRSAPGDQAKRDEAVRRLRDAEKLALFLRDCNLGAGAQRERVLHHVCELPSWQILIEKVPALLGAVLGLCS